MPREKEGYRDELEQLQKAFGNKYVLTLRDVGDYTGRDSRWCKKIYGIDAKKGITQAALARKLCS